MKKIILLLAIGFAAFTANAQKGTAPLVVPAGTKATLAKLYPTAATTATWTKSTGNNVQADFINEGVPTTVIMGPNYNFLSSEVPVKVAELPKGAADFCSGKSVSKTSKITSFKGIVTYKVVADAEYVFDKDGKMIPKTK